MPMPMPMLMPISLLCTAEFRRAIISITDLDKNEASLAIRTRLKVSHTLPSHQTRRFTVCVSVQCEQVKVASKDEGGNNTVKFDPKFWQLPEKALHMLFCVFVETEDAQKELESMKLSEMQGVLRAYATKDRDVPAALLKKTGKGLRESVREALVEAITNAGVDGGVQRYDEVCKVLPQK